MKFLYPMGLIGLVAIPILIIIYIIKNKYTEQTIPSTYLWELSEKFLKKRKRVNPIAGLISLILQIIIAACASLAIAHPVIVLPNQAKEICYVIDASASMNMKKDGVSRLERAKAYAANHIRNSVDGSVFSLIVVSDATTIVCERIDDKEDVLESLSGVTPGYVETSEADAVALLQEYFSHNSGMKAYFLTDCHYNSVQNMEVVNFEDGEKNISVSPLEANLSGTTLLVSGVVDAYGYADNTDVTLEFYLNSEPKASQTQTVTVEKGASVDFSFTCEEVERYEKVRVEIKNAADDLVDDNTSLLYNVYNENAYDVLVVSDTPYLISAAIKATGNAKVTVLSHMEYANQRGYGLYVFDGIAPTELPTDGAMWFLNVKSSVPGTGFSFQAEETLEVGEKIELSESSSSLAQKLLKDVDGKEIYISKYLRYGRSKYFVPLVNYKNTPILFTGVTDAGNREVVFAFDIHDTDFPLHTDFALLVRNLLNYSFPAVVEEVSFFGGETLSVNIVSGMNTVRVEAPSGKVVYLPTASVVAEYVMTEVGIHKITATFGEDNQRSYYVYGNVPMAERNPYKEADYIGLRGEATDGGLDGKYDTMNIWFALIALCFLVDWGVYCYEKYQLR